MDVWYPANRQATDTLPVLLFSPALDQTPAVYHGILSAIAAKGYAVLAVRHQYPEPFNFATQVAPLAFDLLEGLDFATRRQAEHDPVFMPLDLRRVGAFGHSYGGTVAIEACTRDSRIAAAMDIDGTVFGRAVVNGAPCPVFLLFATLPWTERFRREPPKFLVGHDRARIHEEMLYARSATVYWLIVRGLDHMSFTDEALTPGVAKRFAARTGLLLDARQTHAMTERYLSAFFGRYLRTASADTAILERSPYNFATLRRKLQ